jgi:hypothetical protein
VFVDQLAGVGPAGDETTTDEVRVEASPRTHGSARTCRADLAYP